MGSIHDCFSAPGVAAVLEVIVQSEHTGSYQNISTEANTNNVNEPSYKQLGVNDTTAHQCTVLLHS